jgi:hypothetical protein
MDFIQEIPSPSHSSTDVSLCVRYLVKMKLSGLWYICAPSITRTVYWSYFQSSIAQHLLPILIDEISIFATSETVQKYAESDELVTCGSSHICILFLVCYSANILFKTGVTVQSYSQPISAYAVAKSCVFNAFERTKVSIHRSANYSVYFWQ